MIKSRSQPSYFKLQAEAQPWNFEGKFCSCSSDSFNSMTVESMLPVTPMGSVTPPATSDRDSKVGSQLILSFQQRHPSLLQVELHQVFLQHQGIPPIPPKVFHQLDIHHLRNNGIQWMFYFVCAGYVVSCWDYLVLF